MKAYKQLASLFFLLFLVSSCNEENDNPYKVLYGRAQGTTYSIKYISEEDYLVSQTQIDSIFEAFDASLSTYKPNSIISKINNGDSTVVVDAFFRMVYDASDKIFYETNGLFDPTVAPLVNAYGFGPSENIQSLSQKELDSVRLFVGLNKTQITDDSIMQKAFKATKFDFNAIAQGYTVDIIVDFLVSKSIKNAIVEVGGEVRSIGRNEVLDKCWVVGVDHPLQTNPNERELYTTVMLEDMSLATSGNYRKVKKDSLTGKYYVHTINPNTGFPHKSNVLSATVVAPKCIYADAYATVFMLMTVDETKLFLESNPSLNVLLIYQNEEGDLVEFRSPNFPE